MLIKVGNFLVLMDFFLVVIIIAFSLFNGDNILDVIQFCLVLTSDGNSNIRLLQRRSIIHTITGLHKTHHRQRQNQTVP